MEDAGMIIFNRRLRGLYKTFKDEFKENPSIATIDIVRGYHSMMNAKCSFGTIDTYHDPSTFNSTFEVERHNVDINRIGISESQLKRLAHKMHYFMLDQPRMRG